MTRNFAGIWIPASLWENTDLSILQKVLLVEIDSLDNGERGCYASNAYFATFFCLSAKHVSRVINELVELGLITSEIIHEGKKVKERRLKMVYPINKPFIVEGIPKNADTPEMMDGVSPKMRISHPQECGEPHRKNAAENNTGNSKGNNPLNNPKDDEDIPVFIHSELLKEIFNFYDIPRRGKLYKHEPIHDQIMIEAYEKSVIDQERLSHYFWLVFPNKKASRPDVVKAFKKIDLKKNTPALIFESLAEHKITRNWLKDNGQFIPHATTWLNQSRWLAEFSESDFIVNEQPNLRTQAASRLSNNSDLDELIHGDASYRARDVTHTSPYYLEG